MAGLGDETAVYLCFPLRLLPLLIPNFSISPCLVRMLGAVLVQVATNCAFFGDLYVAYDDVGDQGKDF
jgi:hypothetical protein